jgi:hypothetical protein
METSLRTRRLSKMSGRQGCRCMGMGDMVEASGITQGAAPASRITGTSISHRAGNSTMSLVYGTVGSSRER